MLPFADAVRGNRTSCSSLEGVAAAGAFSSSVLMASAVIVAATGMEKDSKMITDPKADMMSKLVVSAGLQLKDAAVDTSSDAWPLSSAFSWRWY